MGVSKITIEGLKLTCERCGYSWISHAKLDKLPRTCPKCVSSVWNSSIQYPKMSEARRKVLQEKRQQENQINT